MKTKVRKYAVATVLVAAVGYGVYQAQAKDTAMSEIALANVEALGWGEYDPNIHYGAELYMCKDKYGSYTGARCKRVQDRTAECRYADAWGDCD